MEQMILRTRLHKFDSCSQFAQEFDLGEKDLIFTNGRRFRQFFEPLGFNGHTIFREKYGSDEPTDVMADAIIKDMKGLDFDRIIAVGGGSIIDRAKVLAVAGADGIDDLYDRMPDLKKQKELIVIPTTCGTGSEVTNLSIINRTKIGTKMGLVADSMFPDHAVLIPQTLHGMPSKVFATSSIDALVHATESALSPKRTAYTKMMSHQAISMIVSGYRQLARAAGDEQFTAKMNELMDDFLVASNMAGIAFGSAGCGTVHALAYPLGGRYHVAHGESNYVLFTATLKKYEELEHSRRAGGRDQHDGMEFAHEQKAGSSEANESELDIVKDTYAKALRCSPDAAFDKLSELLGCILAPRGISEYGVPQEELDEFVTSVMENQQRLLANSYIPVTKTMLKDIYQSCY